MKKIVSVVTPTYNEEENVIDLIKAVKDIFRDLPSYDYEHLFIDNASEDDTVKILKKAAMEDKKVKVIVNAKNFGHIRSPFYGLLQTTGDAAISLSADFQDPPEMIKEFVKKWEAGSKIVVGIKAKSKESFLMFSVRRLFYLIISKISETEYIKNFTGFGLYDRSFVDELRKIKDPYPYFRGLVAQLGYDREEIEFIQPKRKAGKTSNNFYTLFDMAMLGFVNHSKVPLRLASFLGFAIAILSFLVAVVYFVLKLIYWNEFKAGVAPLLIGFFFFSAIQLFFIGMVGEYIGAIYTQVQNRPLVVERERINLDKEDR